jgi:hypothetical protein
MTTLTMGTLRRLISRRLTAIGLGLAALLSPQARVRARRIHERDDGHAELLGQLHLGQGLAVPLRVGAAEMARELLLLWTCLLWPTSRTLIDSMRAKPVTIAGHPEAAVPVQLAEVAAEGLDVVPSLGPAGMAGHADRVPGREAP